MSDNIDYNFINELKQQVADNHIFEAIQKIFESNLDKSIKNEALLLLNRFKDLNGENNKGIVTYENYKIERNKIVNSLINIIVVIEKILEKEHKETQESSPNKLGKIKDGEEVIPLKSILKDRIKKEENKASFENLEETIEGDSSNLLPELLEASSIIFYIKYSGIVEFQNNTLKNDAQLRVMGDLISEVNRIRSSSHNVEFQNENYSKPDPNFNSMQSIMDNLKNSDLVLFAKIKKTSIDNEELDSIVDNATFGIFDLLGGSAGATLWGTVIFGISALLLSPIFLTVGLLLIATTLKIDIITIYVVQKNNPKISVKDGKCFYNSN